MAEHKQHKDKKKSESEKIDDLQQKESATSKAPESVESEIFDEAKANLDEVLHEDSEDNLESKVKDLQAQLDSTDDKYLRAQAEIANMHSRFKKEQDNLMKYDGQSLAKAILPVMDNLERALAIEVTDENGTQLKKGIEMTYSHLEQALTSNNVEEIPAKGEIFDPNLHQAVQTVAAEEGQKPEQIVNVLQKGYKLKDRVLRPAMVIVAQ